MNQNMCGDQILMCWIVLKLTHTSVTRTHTTAFQPPHRLQMCSNLLRPCSSQQGGSCAATAENIPLPEPAISPGHALLLTVKPSLNYLNDDRCLCK